MLTHQQRKLLIFICDYIEREKVSPSFMEMQDALGLASRSGIHRLVQNLIDRGYVTSIPNRARAIEILRGPDGKDGGFRLTPDEIKAIGFLRTNKVAMRQILESCQ
jgi:repressor LexA